MSELSAHAALTLHTIKRILVKKGLVVDSQAVAETMGVSTRALSDALQELQEAGVIEPGHWNGYSAKIRFIL